MGKPAAYSSQLHAENGGGVQEKQTFLAHNHCLTALINKRIKKKDALSTSTGFPSDSKNRCPFLSKEFKNTTPKANVMV